MAVFAAALLWPERALGIDITPWDGLSPFDDIIKGVGGVAGDAIKSGFQYIVNVLFGGPPAELTVAILRWLIEIPNYTRGSGIGGMEQTTTAIAFALLGCVLTYAVLRFWVAGIAAGNFDALSAIGRTVVAVVAIALWPRAFGLFADLSGAISSAVLNTDATKDNVGALLASSMSLGSIAGAGTGIPLFLGIAIAVVGMILLFVLALAKVMIAAITVLLFVGMPLALVLWPLPETSWLAGSFLRSFMVVISIPIVWAIVFGSFAALWADTIFLQGNEGNGSEIGLGGSLADAALIKPLVGLSLLYLAVTLPKKMLAMASMGGGGGGGVLRSFAYQAAFSSGYSALGGRAGRAAGNAGFVGGGRLGGGASPTGGALAGAGRGAAQPPIAAAAGGAGIGAAGGPAAVAAATRAPVSVPAASGNAGAGGHPRDQWGGPRLAMNAERSAAIQGGAEQMAGASPRPGVAEVQSAAAALPTELAGAAQRVTLDSAESTSPGASDEARQTLAGYGIHAAGQPYRSQLQTIGSADARTWQGAFGGAPAGGVGLGAADALNPIESQARALLNSPAGSAPSPHGTNVGAEPSIRTSPPLDPSGRRSEPGVAPGNGSSPPPSPATDAGERSGSGRSAPGGERHIPAVNPRSDQSTRPGRAQP